MSKTPEGSLLDRVITYLEEHKIYYERRNATGLNYRKGAPDLWCVLNGVHIEIELKRDDGKGKRSASQIKWEQRFKKFGVTYWLIDNFAEFVNLVACTL